MEPEECERIFVKNVRNFSLIFPLLRTLTFMAHDKMFICLHVKVFPLYSEDMFSNKKTPYLCSCCSYMFLQTVL